MMEPEPGFALYGASHFAALAVFALGALVLVWLGRRQRGTPAAASFSRAFALLNLLMLVPLQLYAMAPGNWDIAGSLPLQLCDLAWIASAIALWTRGWRAHALTYYWGLTLSTQALITPALSVDFPHVVYFMFWGLHLLVVWAGIYLTWGLGLAPNWHSYRFALLATLVWAAVALTVNALAGTNYGFLSEKPPVKSLMDLLGPWPWYLAVEAAGVAAVWALITWPWVRRPRPSVRAE